MSRRLSEETKIYEKAIIALGKEHNRIESIMRLLNARKYIEASKETDKAVFELSENIKLLVGQLGVIEQDSNREFGTLIDPEPSAAGTRGSHDRNPRPSSSF